MTDLLEAIVSETEPGFAAELMHGTFAEPVRVLSICDTESAVVSRGPGKRFEAVPISSLRLPLEDTP